MNAISPGEKLALNANLVLRVRYAPVKQPFVQPQTPASTTLAAAKALALTHFGLTEGAVDGGTKTYEISVDETVQTNLSLTLGELATHGRQIELLLIEQFQQG
ncbi:MAG TPA: hypothetical protein VE934_02290 [Polaromonas sp.]|uniref:hypothetical protein n=1 Tax=Polaromonas sp. TaxID=1869339 RepID=UPI002D3B5696|nr:hypothetical protein [Polaromonas sp.]HYW55763.1 hypothetical protein [Polaromonas sp.]